MLVTCQKCKKVYDYDKYNGICPKCCTYNRGGNSANDDHQRFHDSYDDGYRHGEYNDHQKYHDAYDRGYQHGEYDDHQKYHDNYDKGYQHPPVTTQPSGQQTSRPNGQKGTWPADKRGLPRMIKIVLIVYVVVVVAQIVLPLLFSLLSFDFFF